MEAAELAIFMVSASVFTILLYHPASPAIRAIPSEFVRRVMMGLAMGLSLIGLVYSPWGKRSGAHMNPAFTFTFWRLGKVAPWDAVLYSLSQFLGGLGGVLLVAMAASRLLSHPSVNYVATLPGPSGPWVAFVAEAGISFVLMLIVLILTNRGPLARFTGLVAGVCVATFITFESPLSGMSMNPARTLASALWAREFSSLWIYFLAPPLGMLAAAAQEALQSLRGEDPAEAAAEDDDPLRPPGRRRTLLAEDTSKMILVVIFRAGYMAFAKDVDFRGDEHA